MTASKSTPAPIEPWRRSAGVTALRALLAAVIIATVGVAGVLADLYLGDGGSEGWEDLQAIAGVIVMLIAGFGYATLVYWWLDHLIARRGSRAVLLIHTGVAAGIAVIAVLVGGGLDEGVGVTGIAVVVAVVAVLWATLAAQLIPGSFEKSDPAVD